MDDPKKTTPKPRSKSDANAKFASWKKSSFVVGAKWQQMKGEDDEIDILKGTIDYRSKKKADSIANLGTFHEFIKMSLHVDASKVQLQDKIRRLKKYMNNAGKEKGKERVLTKAHEQKEYELSKKIWDKEKSDKWVQVEVVKVDNVAASMGLKKGGVKDNGVLFEVNEEK
ncbi:putative histone H3.3-like [Capsicum annuum]|nr:putative histone H3.3-like [Capsicum annuum]